MADELADLKRTVAELSLAVDVLSNELAYLDQRKANSIMGRFKGVGKVGVERLRQMLPFKLKRMIKKGLSFFLSKKVQITPPTPLVDTPVVSVVLLSYNGLSHTKACLHSLFKNTHYPCWELIVVDNASNEATVRYLKKIQSLVPEMHLVLHDNNEGFAKGMNAGIQQSQGDYVVLLNNDTYVTSGWMQALVRRAIASPECGVLSPVTDHIQGKAKVPVHFNTWIECEREAYKFTQKHLGVWVTVPYTPFFCVMIPRQVIKQVGELSEAYGLGMFEDNDYCKAIEVAGYKVAIVFDSFVHHHNAASFSLLGMKQHEELLRKNKAIFDARW